MGLALIAITIILFISFHQSRKIRESSTRVDHTRGVIQLIQKQTITALELQAAARGYVMTGRESNVQKFKEVKGSMNASLLSLKSLVTDNPLQLNLFDSLNFYMNKRAEISNELISLRQQNRTNQANELVAAGLGKFYIDKIRETGTAMEKIENDLLYKRKKANDDSIRNLNKTLNFVLITTIIASLLLFFKIKGNLKTHRATEQKFRALLEAAPDAMVIANEQDKIVMINQKAAALFGYSASEIYGKPVSILIPQTLQSKHRQKREAYIAAPGTKSMKEGLETAAINKDGLEFPVEITLSPIQTNEGLLLSASIRDITKRKKSQQQFELLLQQVNESNDAIVTLNTKLEITNWNYGAEKLYGYTKEEALGKTSIKLLPMDLNETSQLAIQEKISTEGYWTGEVKRFGKNNAEVFVISSITAFKNKAGEITGYISVSYDISQQKELQQQITHLANIVEHSSDAILSRGPDKRIMSWNEGAEKMLGYTKEEAIGKKAPELGMVRFTPGESREVDAELSVKGKWQAEKTYYCKNGDTIIGSVSGNAIKNSAGEVISEVFIIKDISMRRHMEEFLKNTNDDLEEKVRERTEELYKVQKRFKAMIENSDDLISVMDENKNMIYRSPAAERITGRSNKEVYDIATFKSMFDEAGFKEMQGHIKKAFENPGIPVFSPFRILNKEGGFKEMEGTVTNFLQDENIKAIVFNARDITERKMAEQKLMASEKRYREALDNMLEGCQIFSSDLEYLYVNEALAKQAGLPREKLIGRRFNDLYPGMEETPLYKNMMKCLEERVSIHMENEFVFPDKTYKFFQLSFQPVPEGFLLMSVDITERKNAEKELLESLHEKELLAEKFSVILNRLPANIALLDENGIIREVNEGWKEFILDNDYKGDNYGLGQPYIEIASASFFVGEPEQCNKIAMGINAALNNQGNYFEFEHPCHCLHDLKWFKMIISPFRHKTFSGAVIMHVNITELKRLEQERLQNKLKEQRNITRAMLQGQEKERNQIGRELHDNIVQLMAATKMKLGLFASQHGSRPALLGQSMDHLQAALTETRNLSHQMVTPRFTVYTFRSELERLFADYGNDKRKISLKIAAIDETSIPLPLKETLYRIAQEQLHNIEKYAGASQLNLVLYVKDACISMIISDNGAGFDLQMERKGIGLTNIYNRAESFGGTASIITEPGRGCTLIVEIPLANISAT